MGNIILIEETHKKKHFHSDVIYHTCELNQNFHLQEDLWVHADYHSWE